MSDFKCGDLVLITFTFIKDEDPIDLTFTTIEFLENNRKYMKGDKDYTYSHRLNNVKRHELVICLNTSPCDEYFKYYFKGRFLGHDKTFDKIKYNLISSKNNKND